jgi:NAD-dependent deacetylase
VHHPLHEESTDEALARAAQLLSAAAKVAVLTGAGISAESGLATFRGAGGLWEGHRVEEVATPQAFASDPALVWRFYHARRAALSAVRPNPGHLALAELERRLPAGNFTLITQNVDGLHQQAGSRNVLEIHGALRRVRCSRCSVVSDRGSEALPEMPACPECGHLLRPDVVWFNEPLPWDVWKRGEDAVQTCGCFLVVGTSAVVYPAAGLIDTARLAGVPVIELNLTATAASARVDVALQGPAGTILPELLRRL